MPVLSHLTSDFIQCLLFWTIQSEIIIQAISLISEETSYFITSMDTLIDLRAWDMKSIHALPPVRLFSCNDAWLLTIKGSSIKFYWKDTFFNRTRNPNYLPISRSIHSLKIQSKL